MLAKLPVRLMDWYNLAKLGKGSVLGVESRTLALALTSPAADEESAFAPPVRLDTDESPRVIGAIHLDKLRTRSCGRCRRARRW